MFGVFSPAGQRHSHHDGTEVSQSLISLLRQSSLDIFYYRDNEDVFAQEILEPYCKFCYAKKFKMSAIALQEILEIAPQTAYCI